MSIIYCAQLAVGHYSREVTMHRDRVHHSAKKISYDVHCSNMQLMSCQSAFY